MNPTSRNILKLLAALLVLLPTGTQANFNILHSFNGSDGMDAYSQALLHDQVLYTTAVRGGIHNKGTLISFDLRTDTRQTLHHFNGSDGRAPFNLNALDQDTVYGVTRADEIAYKGVLFSHNMAAGQTKIIHRFEGAPNGAEHMLFGPILHQNLLYGLSNRGGEFNAGALYRVGVGGEDFTLLHSFNAGQGSRPFGGLLAFDGWLLGTVSDITLREKHDPANTSFGAIFKIRPDGSDFQFVYQFQGHGKGGHPYGGLQSDGHGWLYGTTLGEYNNLDDEGVIFRIDTSFEHYQVLHDFAEQPGDGSKPNGDLVFSADGSILYGFSHATLTAPLGGDSPFFGETVEPGTLFQMRSDGSDFKVLHRFDSAENGLVPERTPILSEGYIYGTAAGGGVHSNTERPDGMGIIFSYELQPPNSAGSIPEHGSGSVGLGLLALCSVFIQRLRSCGRGRPDQQSSESTQSASNT